jgi:hypothetical protein
MIHLALFNPDSILEVVCRVTDVPIKVLRSKDRHLNISTARLAAYYIMREEGHSFPVIGRSILRDHTSAMAGYKKARALAHNDPQFNLLIKTIQRALHASKELPMSVPSSLQEFINRCASRVDDIKNTKDEGVFAKRYEEDVTILLRLVQNKNESLETLYQRSV